MSVRVTKQYIQILQAAALPTEPVVSSALGLSVTASYSMDPSVSVTSALGLTVTASVTKSGIPVSVNSRLDLFQTAETNIHMLAATSGLTLSVSADYGKDIPVAIASVLSLFVTADPNITYVSAESILDLDSNSIGIAAANGIPVHGSSPLGLSVLASKTQDYAISVPVFLGENNPADRSETLLDLAITVSLMAPLNEMPSSVLSFSQTASYILVKGHGASSVLSLTQTATLTGDYNRSVASVMNLASRATAYKVNTSQCEYNPISDGWAGMPTSRNLGSDTLEISYPTTNAVRVLALRNAEFGDSLQLGFDRVNTETRGNQLVVIIDDHWPEYEELNFEVRGLCGTDRDSIISFVDATLGLECRLVDHFGRVWHGFITTPQNDVLEYKAGVFEWAFNFRGVQQ